MVDRNWHALGRGHGALQATNDALQADLVVGDVLAVVTNDLDADPIAQADGKPLSARLQRGEHACFLLRRLAVLANAAQRPVQDKQLA
jgi:hypothetical protein